VPTKDRGTTPEIIAAVEVCLKAGADINDAGANGDTALHFAVTGRGDLEIVKYLVEHGASPAIKNTRGQTALDAAKASRKDRSEIVAYLSAR
jgi:ankyrin repeat protein